MAEQRHHALISRQRHTIRGIVQGVGFRPFVYRIAQQLGLTGWVRNTPAGVELEIQGSPDRLGSFATLLSTTLPPLAEISSHEQQDIAPVEEQEFVILSSSGGGTDIRIAPDSAICPDCLNELLDSSNRRYRYPFITCTNCGPRYSIITGVPYDRPATTMADFPLCPDCRAEYNNPRDRRFHAQPIACHACGPRVTLRNSQGEITAAGDAAIHHTIALLKDGAIVAIKGIGGYHLAVDATNHAAVQRLHQRKKRDEKPFAVMAASLEIARSFASLNDREERLLCSPEAPIVIARKKDDTPLAPLIAPGNGWLGLLLPYTPLHQLLFNSSPLTPDPHFTALVMTSGNISDEPVAYSDADALHQLADIADAFLCHDRPIHIRCDDSVLRVFQGKPLFYRRARGYTPKAITLPMSVPPLLAVGAELKNAVCLATAERAFLSQHIGDLKNQTTYSSFNHTIAHLSDILGITPELVACDLHPDYHSSRFAEECGLPVVQVQHHHAHLAACMAENGLTGEVVGIIFDGTGYGSDGTIWGGEFLIGGYETFRRAGHFRPLALPGGDAAVQQPWRMAMSYLYQALGTAAFDVNHPVARMLAGSEQQLFKKMLDRGINSPLTSSCGRLFDAVAALLNIRHIVSYDGQGAIELEALAEQEESAVAAPYRYELHHDDSAPFQLDFSATISDILADLARGISTARIALRFHHTVAAAAAAGALHACRSGAINRVVLSGGVFQNRLLSEMIYTALTEQGVEVFCHRLVPPNDGGIALGQAAIAALTRTA
jgi:hydrogenase maturation protein HypF